MTDLTLEQRARELRGIGSAIVAALAQIVNAPQTDEQCNAEVIPRGFVMDQIMRIREQFDKLGPIADALQQAQQPSAQAVGVIRDNPDDIGLYADLDVMPPVGTKLYTAAPTLPDVTDSITHAEGFYLASFKGQLQDEVLWWRPDNRGYTTDLCAAGVYTEIQPGYHDSEDTIPVPAAFVESLHVRHVLHRCDEGNNDLWTAETMRARLRARHAKGGA